MTAFADAIAKAGYKPERDLLYVALQRFYGACDGKDFLTTVTDIARHVADDMSGKALPPREGNGQHIAADLGHRSTAIPDTVSEVQMVSAIGQARNDLRKPFEQEHRGHAERPMEVFPAQSNSMGQGIYADSGHKSVAHRTPNGGNGQDVCAHGHTTSSVAAVPAKTFDLTPVKPKEPSLLSRMIRRQVSNEVARSVMETYIFADGRKLGDVWSDDLLEIEKHSSADAFIARQIRLKLPAGTRNTRLRHIKNRDFQKEISAIVDRSLIGTEVA